MNTWNCQSCAATLHTQTPHWINMLNGSSKVYCDGCAGLADLPGEGIYGILAHELGGLVADKQRQYGRSVQKTGAILSALYPDGVAPHQFDDALLIVRVLDKLSRISQRGPDGLDLGGESPWKDIAGYGLLGWEKDSK